MQTFKGFNGTIDLYEDYVVIKKGMMFGNTEKRIYLRDINGIQYKALGMTRAHIEIKTAEDKDNRLSVVQQPNVILLKSRQDTEAKEFVQTIEDAILKAKSEECGKKSESSSSADEILKFKRLLDEGVITAEEFDAKKKQLLGI